MHTVPFSDPRHALFFLSVIYLKKASFIGSYRPQTKFAKVMFLHVSVILSTGGIGIGGVGWYGGGMPACLAGLQAHTQGGS